MAPDTRYNRYNILRPLVLSRLLTSLHLQPPSGITRRQTSTDNGRFCFKLEKTTKSLSADPPNIPVTLINITEINWKHSCKHFCFYLRFSRVDQVHGTSSVSSSTSLHHCGLSRAFKIIVMARERWLSVLLWGCCCCYLLKLSRCSVLFL